MTYYELNKEEIKQYQNEYRIKNKEEINRKRRERYIKNKEEEKKKALIYYHDNKEERKKINKQYKQNNKDKLKLTNKKWIENPQNKEKIVKWKEENKEKIKKTIYNWRNEKFKNDIAFKLSYSIRSSINNAFKKYGFIKESQTYDILGCTFEELKQHLESQFQPWMTWDNHGLYNGNFEYGWDIDHIEPLFPEGMQRTPEDIIRLNHYTNLQPLCSCINRYVKRNRVI